MSYLGNTPTTQSFISGTDYFNGTGSQTAFTLSRTVASVNDIQAVVNNVVQVPNDAYTISGTTITFTSAPSAGTQNVYVRYLSTTTQAITPSQNTVSWNTLDANTRGDLGISFKNRIINGNMAIDQRNAGASVNVTTSNVFGVDRWKFDKISSCTYTVQQSSTAPTGFSFSSLVTVGTGAASGASDYVRIIQNIEGFNTADLGWGTANAQTVTVSFWVRSSIAGTYCFGLQNSATNYSYPVNYTINSANTWEYKTITVVGPTAGTWVGATNGIGILCTWDLGSGSNWNGTNATWQNGNTWKTSSQTAFTATSGATFYLTGVQLEVGTQATTFTLAGGSYGAELALCQRYYYTTGNVANPVGTGGGFFGMPLIVALAFAQGNTSYKATMRATPTITLYDGNGLAGTVTQHGVADAIPASAGGITANGFMQVQRASGSFNGSAGYPVTGGYTASIEL